MPHTLPLPKKISQSFKGNSVGGNDIIYPAKFEVETQAIPAVGLGVGQKFVIQGKEYASMTCAINDITEEQEETDFVINTIQRGELSERMRLSKTFTYLSGDGLYEASDKRLKSGIKQADIQSCLDKIMELELKNFTYKSDNENKLMTGVIAQELKEVIPNAVSIRKWNEISDCHFIEVKELVGNLIGAVQQLSKDNDDLRKRLSKLEPGQG